VFTVLGSSGFIGSALVTYLRQRGETVFCPPRNFKPSKVQPLGNLVYCIGLTADFRTRPYDTLDAHICLLTQYLSQCTYDTFSYLSSTRIYEGSNDTSEDAILNVQPSNPGHLYNLTKLAGEAACHALAGNRARIVRLSNVIGADWSSPNFLFSLIRDAVCSGVLQIDSSPNSEKDYIFLADVVEVLYKIALQGKYKVYNVAHGQNISNEMLVGMIMDATGCLVKWTPGGPENKFHIINNIRMVKEFGITQTSLKIAVRNLIDEYKKVDKNENCI